MYFHIALQNCFDNDSYHDNARIKNWFHSCSVNCHICVWGKIYNNIWKFTVIMIIKLFLSGTYYFGYYLNYNENFPSTFGTLDGLYNFIHFPRNDLALLCSVLLNSQVKKFKTSI